MVQAYIDEVYTKFGGCIKIMLDNGTEFKNQLFMDVATQLGVACKVYSPPYHPQSNGRIEGFHNFLKACMPQHVSKSLESDHVIPLACNAYNFLPDEHSKESSLFLMFGRDPIVLLNSLLKPTVRYLGTDENTLSLEALKNMYQLITSSLEQAQRKGIPKPLYLIENLVRVIPFYLRITPQVCGTLGILDTIKLYPFLEGFKLRW